MDKRLITFDLFNIIAHIAVAVGVYNQYGWPMALIVTGFTVLVMNVVGILLLSALQRREN
jgi:hypothetical protein